MLIEPGVWLFASGAADVWLTPIHWHLTAEEIDYVLRDSGARVLFADDAHADAARASGVV